MGLHLSGHHSVCQAVCYTATTRVSEFVLLTHVFYVAATPGLHGELVRKTWILWF